jgi:hypothetical protein
MEADSVVRLVLSTLNLDVNAYKGSRAILVVIDVGSESERA